MSSMDDKTELERGLEEKNAAYREKVVALSAKLKDLKGLPDLINEVYQERQITLEYHNAVLRYLAELNKMYKVEYAKQYNYFKAQSEIRYSTESAINTQCAAALSDFVYRIDLLNNHAKYIQDTIKSIDDIIYAIPNRIRIEELILGK